MNGHDSNEQVFRELATRYIEQHGEQLERERLQLEEQEADRITPGLDRKVSRETGKRRSMPIRYAALLAACLALVVLTPVALRNRSLSPAGQDAELAAEASGEAESEDSPAPSMEAEVIPLSFPLPEQFAVTDVKQDRGQSIYYLEDQALDNVVMTLELAGEESSTRTEGLTKLSLGGGTAYASTGQDYSLLTFVDNGILYTLTCKHDINTLTRLGAAIL